VLLLGAPDGLLMTEGEAAEAGSVVAADFKLLRVGSHPPYANSSFEEVARAAARCRSHWEAYAR
jgi:hypothetical protein